MSDTGIKHKDGVPWFQAPRPWPWHRCRVHSEGHVGPLVAVQRCACGAIRLDSRDYWRNARGLSRLNGPYLILAIPVVCMLLGVALFGYLIPLLVPALRAWDRTMFLCFVGIFVGVSVGNWLVLE